MNKVFQYSVISLSFLMIAFVSAFIMQSSVYCADDLAFNFLEAPLNISRKLCYGAWVMKFQYVLMYILPHEFSMDFQSWGLTFGVFFKSLTLLLFPICAFCFYLVKKIPRLISLLLSVISFFLLFAFYYKTQFVDFIIYTGFFRFVLPSLLLFISLFFMYILYFGVRVNSFFLLILGYICAFSSEVVAGILLSFSLLLLLFRFIEAYKNKFQNVSVLPFISFFSGLIIGTLRLITTVGFSEHFFPKLGEMHISLPLIFQNIPDFLYVMFSSMIIDYYYFWIIVLIFVIYNKLNKHNKANIFSFSVLFGVFVFACSLIIMGKTNYEGEFWIVHNDIHAIFIPCFIFIIMVLSSELITKNFSKAVFKYSLIALFIFSGLLFYFSASFLYQKLSVIKDYTYLRDKMVLFYTFKGQKPILPISVFIYNIYFPDLPPFNSDLVDEATAPELSSPYDYSLGVLMMKLYYYPLSYGVNVFREYDEPLFLNHNQALELFKSYGGSYDEILDKSYKFSDLNNTRFIMNNNIRLIK